MTRRVFCLVAEDTSPPFFGGELNTGDTEILLENRAEDDPAGDCYVSWTPETSMVLSGPLPGYSFRGVERTRKAALIWATAVFVTVYEELIIPGRWCLRVSRARKEKQ